MKLPRASRCLRHAASTSGSFDASVRHTLPSSFPASFSSRSERRTAGARHDADVRLGQSVVLKVPGRHPIRDPQTAFLPDAVPVVVGKGNELGAPGNHQHHAIVVLLGPLHEVLTEKRGPCTDECSDESDPCRHVSPCKGRGSPQFPIGRPVKLRRHGRLRPGTPYGTSEHRGCSGCLGDELRERTRRHSANIPQTPAAGCAQGHTAASARTREDPRFGGVSPLQWGSRRRCSGGCGIRTHEAP